MTLTETSEPKEYRDLYNNLKHIEGYGFDPNYSSKYQVVLKKDDNSFYAFLFYDYYIEDYFHCIDTSVTMKELHDEAYNYFMNTEQSVIKEVE